MADAADPRGWMKEIFLIDVATVVLSRRAVEHLTAASCPLLEAHCACSTSPSLEGQLRPLPVSSTCGSHAPSAHACADQSPPCRSRKRAFDANICSVPERGEVPANPQAQRTSPLPISTCADVPEASHGREEGTVSLAQQWGIQPHGESRSCTGCMPASSSAHVGELGNIVLCSTQDSVSSIHSASVCLPCSDSSRKFEARDKWPPDSTSCRAASEREQHTDSELLVRFDAVPSPRQGRSQKSHKCADCIPAKVEENEVHERSRWGNTATGSHECPKAASGGRVFRCTQAASEKDTHLSFTENERDGSKEHAWGNQDFTEQVYKFLGAAFTATRSSLYVCIPIDATKSAASFGSTYACPFTGAPFSGPEGHDSVGAEGTGVSSFLAGGVVFADGVTSHRYNADPEGIFRPGSTGASCHAEHRSNVAGGDLPDRKTSTLTVACVDAGDAGAAEGNAADSAPVSGASVGCCAVASSFSPSSVVSSAVPPATADVDSVSRPAGAAAPSELVGRYNLQTCTRRRQSSEALLYENGLCCTYIQHAPRQPVLTPTCNVFHLIRHLYAFFAQCANAFTPFAADVYIVPVWIDRAVLRDAGAGHPGRGGAASSPCQACKCTPSEVVTRWSTSTSPTPAGAVGTGGAGEEEVGHEPTCIPAAAPTAQLASTSLAAAEHTVGAVVSLDVDTCGWRERLLQALQSHFRSCRETLTTGEQLVNVVDASFALADRGFALSSAVAEGFAVLSHVLPVSVLHAFRVRPFSDVLSALKTPPASIAVPEKVDLHRKRLLKIGKAATTVSGADICVEKRNANESSSVDGAAACPAKTADDAGCTLHEKATAATPCALEAFETSPVTTEAPVPGRTGTDTAHATDVAVASDARAAALANSERSERISANTAKDGMAAIAAEHTALTNQGNSCFANTLRQFSHVIVAGTFDRLHAGHKLLLTVAALLTGDKLGIGITADLLTKKKEAGDAAQAAAEIQSFAARAHAAAAFVALIATAAWAPTSAAPETNRMGDAFSEAMPASVAYTAGREQGVSKTGHHTADTAAAGCKNDHLPDPLLVCRRDTPTEGSNLVAERGYNQEKLLAIAAVKHGDETATCTASTALKVTSKRQAASIPPRGVPTGKEGAEVTNACGRATLRSVRFINYCQVVLRDEVYSRILEHQSSPAGCDCANRPQADVDATTRSYNALKQRREVIKVTFGRAAARDLRKKEGCYGAGRATENQRNAAELYAGDALKHNGGCQMCTHHGYEEQTDMPAAESSRDAAVPDGTKREDARRESEPVKKMSPVRNRKRSEGIGFTGGAYIKDSNVEEQVRKQEVEEEEQENWWREAVCGAMEEVEATETLLPVTLKSKTSRNNSLSASLAEANTFIVQPPVFAWTSQGKCVPTHSGQERLLTEGDKILLPWVRCVLPPCFSFCGRSRAGYRRPLPAADATGDVPVSNVGNKGSDSAGRAAVVVRRPVAASAPASFVDNLSFVLASSLAAATSTSSAAVSPPTTHADYSYEREAFTTVQSSPPSSFPAIITETHLTSASDRTPSDECGTDLAALSCTTASFEVAAPHRLAYSPPARPSPSGSALEVYLISLEDRLGPAGYLDFDALVVSSESLAGGFYVNEERFKRSHTPVPLIEVPALSASELLTHTRAAAVLGGPDRLERPLCLAPARGGSRVASKCALVCPLTADNNPPDKAPGGCACRGLTSRAEGGHAATHSSASAQWAYGQHQDESAESCPPASTGEVIDLGTNLETAIPSSIEQGLTVRGRKERSADGLERLFNEAFCEDNTVIKDRDQKPETLAAVMCAISTCVGGKSIEVNTKSFKPAPTIDKLSSSHLRQHQAAVLQSCADLACLQRQFAKAAGELFHAPASVWKAYWSTLCSHYVAPWRRLFTVERLARLLSRVVTVKERIPQLRCLDTTCDAIISLSLCFAYALHPPPGLYQRRFPDSCAVPATSSPPPCGGQHLHEILTQCLDSLALQADRKSQLHFLNPCSKRPVVKPYATGARNLLEAGGASVHANQLYIEEHILDVNEQLVRGFLWDAAVCSQLRLTLLRAPFAEQPPVSDTASEKNSFVCSDASRGQENSQINIERAKRDEGDNRSSETLHRVHKNQLLHILVSCMRTTRKYCGFLLPNWPSSVKRDSEVSAQACTSSQDEKSKGTFVEEVSSGPGKSDFSDLHNHVGDLLHSQAEPYEKTLTIRLQQLEIECCRGVRMVELLELALPGVMYDLCARRMREEYYHLCDRHYACHRREQLQNLQMQLSGHAYGLTEAEIGLIRQNLAREQCALKVEDKVEQIELPGLACACD